MLRIKMPLLKILSCSVFCGALCGMLLGLTAPVAALAADGELDCVTTEWKLLGKNHAVCVSAFTDPDIPGVTCYISQARTGGISGSIGLAEDPSNFALACVRTGPLEIPAKLPAKANVFKESTSVFFKATRVTRMWDKARNTLVYVAVSRHIVDGSPYNAISAVPLH